MQVGNDRRRNEVARVAHPLAPRGELRVTGLATEDPSDAFELVHVVDRTEERVLVIGKTNDGVPRLLGQRVDEVAVRLGSDQYARRRGAVLTGIEESADGDTFGGGGDIDVVKDDDRRLATEFEVYALERF